MVPRGARFKCSHNGIVNVVIVGYRHSLGTMYSSYNRTPALHCQLASLGSGKPANKSPTTVIRHNFPTVSSLAAITIPRAPPCI